MLDFHNHLMPGVDDGAADIDEARVGLETLRSHGVNRIITTPHLRASLTVRRPELDRILDVFDQSWDALDGLRATEFSDLWLARGVELMLDVPRPTLSDLRLRLAGTSFVLVEFPFMSLPPNSTVAISELTQSGLTPVIAHPERYRGMAENYELIEQWKDAGARIQINSGSVIGHYGDQPRRIVWDMLRDGLADYLSSDYHSRGKCAVTRCAEMMKDRGGEVQHQALVDTNPNRLAADKPSIPVAPFVPTNPPVWKRVLPWV